MRRGGVVQSEDRYKKVFQHAAFGVLILDLDGRIFDFNQAATRMMGPERGLIHKRYLGDFIGDRLSQSLPEKLKLLDQLGHLTLEARLPGRGGVAADVLLDMTPVPWEDDSHAVLVLLRDLPSRNLMQKENDLQRAAIHTLAGERHAGGAVRWMFLLPEQGKAQVFPPRATTEGGGGEEIAPLFAAPELQKALANAFLGAPAEAGPAWLSAAAEGQAGLARYLRFEFKPLPDPDAKIGQVFAIVEDRTAERLAEEESRRRDQRAMLGLFSDALFHEFNNYLSVILSQASALRLSTPPGRLVPPSVGAILDSAQKAAGLLRRTTETGQEPGSGWSSLNLNAPVAEATRILEHLLAGHVRVRLELGDSLPRVMGDPAHLRTMIVALGRQAEAHMPAGGDLIIRTRRVDPASPASPPGAEVTVADTGVGMDAVTRSQVIESLIPVAAGGTGDNLDLIVARAVALRHRGRCELESAPGRGTTWKITLPGQETRPKLTGPQPGPGVPMDAEAAEQQLAATAAQALPSTPFTLHSAFDSGGRSNVPRPRILLADDEENFRDFVRTILQQNGYDVVTAADGLEAFEHFQEEADKFTLAILDAYMPRLGGLETYLRMQALRPDMPVLFVSGFVRGPSRAALLAACPGRAQVLLKPFTGEQLLLEVGRILESVWSKPA
ncbi:MAG: response regulator [Planctomycetes bacterium]|nr:response regulator [Planctomycetota bacterium]